MPYYQDFKKKKMTREDHLRQDAKKEEEGTRYRKAPQRPAQGWDQDAAPRANAYRGNDNRGFAPRGDNRGEGRSYAPRGNDNRGEGRSYAPRANDDRRPGRAFDRSEKPQRFEKRFDRPQRPAPRMDAPARPAMPARPVAPVRPEMENNEPENLLLGRNPIREALKSGRDIEKLMVAKGDLSGTAREIVAMARENRVPVQMVERVRLDAIARNHQGMIAYASAYQYADVDSMLSDAKEKGEAPFLIILDGVTDPHNLGAIIRTAAAMGAHGVIVPEHRAVGLTPAAVKASAGGIEHIRVARVTNLNREILKLKDNGVWLYGADASGESYRQVDFSGPCALVIGSEGEGISRLVLENCDHIVAVPMRNKEMESLNASVAAGVLLCAAAASRE